MRRSFAIFVNTRPPSSVRRMSRRVNLRRLRFEGVRREEILNAGLAPQGAALTWRRTQGACSARADGPCRREACPESLRCRAAAS